LVLSDTHRLYLPSFFLFMLRPPPLPTLFPYTTLFRSLAFPPLQICKRKPALFGKEGGPGMFLGTYTPKLDDKGRLTLPAKFRDELAGGLMVTKGQGHSLAVYPREEFAERARKAAAVSRTNPEARAFIRNLAASADEQRPDGSGRITLSAAHRK